MHAVILAGGRGSRLAPYTTILPKPLMPVGHMPILELILRQLRSYGFSDVTLAVGYLQHLIRAYFGEGERVGLQLRYSEEEVVLGTAGPLARIVDSLPEDFLVMNGDVLSDINYDDLIRAHAERGAAATIASHEREVKIEFGVLMTDEEDRLLGYQEKPVLRHLVSMGIYMLRRDAVRPLLSEGQYLDMPDLIRTLAERGEQVHCHRSSGLWLDIGRSEDYVTAQTLVEQLP
ncbi:nucleotidyltransferase family protein [Azospirillum sp. ST 5-10]|uniref:nucleotidyltransferase family protein n=1 Tax=unclassified Azospirillum TaxID=2630922 RepID=UPI003F4A0155